MTPSWNIFAYKAQELFDNKVAIEQDIKEREERRKLARKWLSE
jgi:hypothetical protein